VRAGQLSMLQSRPLGLKGANNPLPATGGADPETAASARTNAPLTVRALDRIVSLEDFGDFARSSGGIAKAAASWLWTGTHQAVCVTVAGPGGKAIPAGTLTYRNLLSAMNAASDGMTPTILRSYVARTFDVAASIVVDPTLDPVTVLGAVKDALRSAFSFDAREFAQPVFRSEVIAVMQDVRGVIALKLNGFGYTGQVQNPQADGLVALGPVSTPARLNGATLLTLASGLLPGVVVAS
jgi:predicted phage baseplate assembly protein